MAKASRRVKTLTINKSRDIVVDRLLKHCQDGAHQKCTGWAVLKKEISPIDANYFLKCTCACHRKKEAAKAQVKKVKPKKTVVAKKVAVAKKKAKKGKGKGKAKRKQKQVNKRSSKKKGRKTTRRR